MDCLLLHPAAVACVAFLDRHRRATLELPGHHDRLEHLLHDLFAREVPVDDETLETPVCLRRFAVPRTTLEALEECAPCFLGQVGELRVRGADRSRVDG